MSGEQPEPWRLYDVTLTLREGMPTYPGEPGPEITALQRLADGDRANVSSLSMGLHSGTHVDAPLHFFEGGGDSTTVPLAWLCGPARVVEIQDPKAITRAELERLELGDVERVLFKTRNGELWQTPHFREDFVHLSPAAATWLVGRGVRLVGIDYLSLEAFGADAPRAHQALLKAGVAIVEGLDLRAPPAGDYQLWCLPLKVAGAEAAPARVVLAPTSREGT